MPTTAISFSHSLILSILNQTAKRFNQLCYAYSLMVNLTRMNSRVMPLAFFKR